MRIEANWLFFNYYLIKEENDPGDPARMTNVRTGPWEGSVHMKHLEQMFLDWYEEDYDEDEATTVHTTFCKIAFLDRSLVIIGKASDLQSMYREWFSNHM